MTKMGSGGEEGGKESELPISEIKKMVLEQIV